MLFNIQTFPVLCWVPAHKARSLALVGHATSSIPGSLPLGRMAGERVPTCESGFGFCHHSMKSRRGRDQHRLAQVQVRFLLGCSPAAASSTHSDTPLPAVFGPVSYHSTKRSSSQSPSSSIDYAAAKDKSTNAAETRHLPYRMPRRPRYMVSRLTGCVLAPGGRMALLLRIICYVSTYCAWPPLPRPNIERVR